jgi:hypothetical protein
MSRQLCGLVMILVGGLSLAACAFDQNLLGDSSPLPADPVPLPRPAPKLSAAGPVLPSWRHVPEAVSAQQFDQDKANCTREAHTTPGLGSPEMKFYLAFTSCMHAAGYEATSSL